MTRVPHGPQTSTALSHAGLGTGKVEQAGAHLNSGLPSSSPESRPRSDRVPVPTLVVTVMSLFPTSQVLVLPPARRNSPTGDLKAQEHRPCYWAHPAEALHGHPQACRAALPGPTQGKEPHRPHLLPLL